WCGLTCDEGDYRFRDVIFCKLGRVLFGGAADLADHHDRVGLVIRLKQSLRIGMRRADYWVAADADSCRLAKSERRKLADGLVCQRAGPRNDPDPALFMNVSGHDADLALAGRDDAGAVWPDHSRFARAQI